MPVTGTPVHAPGASPVPQAPEPGASWRREFSGAGSQLRVLRQWLASLLPPCPARDDVVMVAHELGSNAIAHTLSGHGGRFAVEITRSGPVVRVAVADSGAATGPVRIDDPAAEHGRGLTVVRELSVRTGVCGDHLGRLVWADVPWADVTWVGQPAAVVVSPAGQQAAVDASARNDHLRPAAATSGWPACARHGCARHGCSPAPVSG